MQTVRHSRQEGFMEWTGRLKQTVRESRISGEAYVGYQRLTQSTARPCIIFSGANVYRVVRRLAGLRD
jgi:hypothetical protein